ncbi:MAG: CARDB domain-containing protein [Candidatus Bathyarchaeia archaeon]|jgi:uncharacterized membrane protein
MKHDARLTAFVFFALLVLATSVVVYADEETGFTVESTDIQVYRDGVVHVTQTLTVNETFPDVTVPLFSSSIDNLIVLDENQTFLDYEITGTNIDVFSLGATGVSIQYDTHSLTTKEFDVWSLILNTSDNVTVLLPEDTTIVYLNNVPTSIDTQGTQITLTLFPDQWEISYTLPITAPTDFQLTDIQITKNDQGEVTVTVKVTNTGTQKGNYDVPLTINDVTEQTKTVTLDAGGSTTVEFKVTKEDPGTYSVEIDGQTSDFTVDGTPFDDSNHFPVEYIVVVVVAIAAVVALLFFRKKKGPNPENVIKSHEQLNDEEKEVIQFLAEKGGKAFEAEIRDRFPQIPRTSLWRLVRRLEKLDIVAIQKIGLENQVELKK